MADPFIGQIMMFGGNFAIRGWAFCDGSLQSISQNTALFSLLGTIYGGDGQTTFALPDMRGRTPLNQGTLTGGGTYFIGEQAGVETVTLINSQMPNHTHAATGNSADGSQTAPTNGFWGLAANTRYSNAAPGAGMNPAAIGIAGGSQPHENMMPMLCVTFIIATDGIFPPRN